MTTFVRLLQAQDSSLSDNLGGCLNRLQQILTSVPACADVPALPAFDDLNRSPQTTDLLDFEIIHNHPYFRSYHNPLYLSGKQETPSHFPQTTGTQDLVCLAASAGSAL